MPTSHIFIGGAPTKAQVESITIPDDIEAGQIVSFTIGVKTLSVPLTALTRDLIIDEVITAWNASTIPEVAEITAAAVTDTSGDYTGVITLTADTAGKPIAVVTSIGSGNNEKQVVTLSGTAATGGTFTLTYSGQTTGNIAYNASAATVDTALEALSNIGSGDVAVTGDAGGPWTVEFTGALAATNVSLMTINVDNLTGGVNEVQTISSPSNPTGGTFTLSFGGETTAAIAYNANAATVQTRLEALTTIPTGSVACIGGALPGTDVVVTFQDELAATDVALLVADSSSLTGVTGSAAETQTGGSTLANKTTNYFTFGDASSVAADQLVDIVVGVESFATANGGAGCSRVVGGKIDYGLYKSGTGQWQLGSTQIGNYADTDDFSVSVWFKADSTGGKKVVMSLSQSSREPDWAIIQNADSTVSFIRRRSGFTPHESTSSGTITSGTWHNAVGVWDATNNFIRISLDGAAFDSVSASGSEAATSSPYLQLGYTHGTRLYGGGALSAGHFQGFMDGAGFYNEALTISEVSDIYNGGAGDDYPFPASGSNEVQTLTLTGSPSAGGVTVSYQGVGVDIPYNATASEAEDLLDTVSTIGAGNVNVTGGSWPGTALVVEFINALAVTNVELLEIDTSGLVMAVAETTKGVTAPTGSVATSVTPLTQSTTTASEGPNDWSIASNWNTNTVPVTGDTVYLSDSDVSILYGLDQSAVTLAALHIEQSYTGLVGLSRTNSDGTNSYAEYRDQYLKIGATTLFIGDKEGDGSDRIKIDLGTVQSTVLITDSGTGEDTNTPAILFLGTHASNVININRGSLGVAFYPTEVSTIATLRQAFFDDASSDTDVYLGDGVTLTDIIKSGGELDINSATTTFEQNAGETTIHKGAHASLNVIDGTLNYNSTGTLTAVSLSGESVLNFNQDRRPKTVTAITKKSEESEIFDDSGCIAAPVVVMQNVSDLSTLHFGSNNTLTIT